jgi:multidrug transporter EmrE-like cation transporter
LSPSIEHSSTPEQKRRSVMLVVLFTLLAATAQMLMKSSTNSMGPHPTLFLFVMDLATNVPLLGGLALYGIGTAMMIVALKHGELSLLYPIISLSYVWVAILSVLLFHEAMNGLKIAGICVIVTGVAILGRGSRA